MGKSIDEIWEKIQNELKLKKEIELSKDREIYDIREKQRLEYLRRHRIYENLYLTNAPNSSSAGGNLPQVESESLYWALIFGVDLSSAYYSQSMDMDSSGNVYLASIDSSDSQKTVVRKVSSTGDILWERVLINSGSDSDMEICRILSVNDGLIILYRGGLRKLDVDGNLQWSFLQNITNKPLEFTACCLNLSGDALYVFGSKVDGSDVSFEIAQFDITSGTRSNNKEIFINGVNYYSSYSDMFIDTSGNIIISLSWANSLPNYHTTVLKIEPLSSSSGVNILLQWDIDPTEYDSVTSPQPNRQDITSMDIDSNGNIITHGFRNGITSISSDFSSASAVMLDIIQDVNDWRSTALNVSSGDDVFVVGNDGSKIKIVKLNSALTPQFSYTIESSIGDLSVSGWLNQANSTLKIVDDVILLSASIEITGLSPSVSQELFFKLPLNDMSGYPNTSSTTYGDFTFSSSAIVQNILSPNTTSISFTDNDSSWILNDVTLVSDFSVGSTNQTLTNVYFG